MRQLNLFVITGTAIAVATPLLAQPAPPPTAKPIAELQRCRTITDAAARLACYDSSVAALSAATAANELVIVERQDVRKARKGLFGFALPSLGFLDGQRNDVADQEDASRLETTITAARSIGYGKYRFTVASGGTWENTAAATAFTDPEAGDAIVLEKGSLGGYFVRFVNKRRVAAKRVG